MAVLNPLCSWLLYSMTESQNGSGWEGPLEIPSPNLLLRAGLPTASCPGCHNSKKNKKNKSPTKKPFAPIATFPFIRHSWKDFVSIFFIPSQQVFIYSDEVPSDPSLLRAKQSQLSQPLLLCQILQILHPLCGPLLDSFQYVHNSLVLESPELKL